MGDEATRRRGTGGGVLPNVALAIISTLLLLGLLEATARALAPATAEPELAFSPSCLGDFKPNQNVTAEKSGERYRVRINSLGYRGPEPAGAGRLRIVFLGDSFTFGVRVDDDETFASLLAADAGTREPGLGREIESVNLGVSSYGLADQLELLRAKSDRLDPDLVVLVTFAGNDVADELRPASYRSTLASRHGAAGSAAGEEPRERRGLSSLRERSALYGWLRRNVAGRAAHTVRTKTGVFAAPLKTLLESRERPGHAESIEQLWGLFEARLAEFAQECRARDWALVQVVLPTINVGEQVAADMEEFVALNETPFGSVARYESVAASSSVPTINVLEAMRRDPGPVRYYGTEGDHHLSNEGHRLVASLIRDHLRNAAER